MFLLCSIFFALKRQNNTRKHKRGSLQLRHSLFAQTWIRGQAFSALMSGYFVSPGSCNPRPSPPPGTCFPPGFRTGGPHAFLFKLLKNNTSTLTAVHPPRLLAPQVLRDKVAALTEHGKKKTLEKPPKA